jgi:hypothetical protein
MRPKRKELSAFSLSFLDIMSCGLGAFILLFIVAKHNYQADSVPDNDYLTAEIRKLDLQIAEILDRKEAMEVQKNALEQQALDVKFVIQKLEQAFQKSQKDAQIKRKMVNDETAIKKSISQLSAQNKALKKQVAESSAGSRSHLGDGNREYLTGMRLGGEHVLILLDSSTSMLDESIVNIIRRRNMSNEVKKRSPKWRQALDTINWISARFPRASQYQIYSYSDKVEPAIQGTRGKWLYVNNTKQLNETIENLNDLIPDGGSSLEAAVDAIKELRPQPDNIYLITDGLPTQGIKPAERRNVSGQERQQLFERAVAKLPSGIPVNVILLPTEGDPMAPAAYWQIARVTEGSFLSPAVDWP